MPCGSRYSTRHASRVGGLSYGDLMTDEAVELTEEDKESKGLPDLTDRQFGFALDILKGMTASDAYRANYTARNMKPNSLWVAASRLKNSPKVSLWLDRARQGNMRRVEVTKEEHNSDLERIKNDALAVGDLANALKAARAQGELHGHYVSLSKSLTPTEQATDAELLQSIADKMGCTVEDVEERMKSQLH